MVDGATGVLARPAELQARLARVVTGLCPVPSGWIQPQEK